MTAIHRSAPSRRRHPAHIGRLWLLLLLGLGLALASCASGFTCRGCVETVLPGHVVYRYQYLDGPVTRTLNTDAAQTLTMDYIATVDEGTLDMRVVDPDGEAVWQETFDPGADASGRAQVDIQQSGRYRLIVEGHQTRGGFQIDWEVD